MQLVQGDKFFILEQGFRAGQAELMKPGAARRAVASQLEERCLQAFAAFQKENPGFEIKPGKVVGISASYYAAKGAKIDCTQGVLAKDCYRQFKARKEVLLAHCSEQEASEPVADKNVALEIANVVIFCQLFKDLIHEDAEIFFRSFIYYYFFPHNAASCEGSFLPFGAYLDTDRRLSHAQERVGSGRCALHYHVECRPLPAVP